MNSPIAAPHTPIASAKKYRPSSFKSTSTVARQIIISPDYKTTKNNSSTEEQEQSSGRYSSGSYRVNNNNSSTHERYINTQYSSQNQNNYNTGNKTLPPPSGSQTPSKQLFSPVLRKDPTNAIPSAGKLPVHISAPTHGQGRKTLGHSPSSNPSLPSEEIKQYTLYDDEDYEERNSPSFAAPTRSSHSNLSSSLDDEEFDPDHEDDPDDEDDEGNYPRAGEEGEDDEEYNAFNPYQFIANLPDYETANELRTKPVNCPLPGIQSSRGSANSSSMTLVLDLDETLVHCTVEPVAKPDLIFPVVFNGVCHQVYVRKRPYLDHFLETVSKHFEVVLFTASQRVYADVLLDVLDPQKKFISHRLFRESCLLVQGNYLKDLIVLGRDLKKTLLVDNSPYAYGYQVDNGVPILSWYDDENDTELLKLIEFLEKVKNTRDVRPYIRKQFKTYRLVSRAKDGKPVSMIPPSLI